MAKATGGTSEEPEEAIAPVEAAPSRRMVIHRDTIVQTMFSVCDEEGNLLFDYPVTQSRPSFGMASWNETRRQNERIREMLKSGEIADADQPVSLD